MMRTRQEPPEAIESGCGQKWFAVYTKPRQEHIALLNLERQSFECYLPIAENPSRRRGVPNQTRHEPLFPRYLFLKADQKLQSLVNVRSTRGVVSLVRAGVELIKIPGSIIGGLKTRMHPATGLISLEPNALAHGDKVRVFGGPFAALEGIFQSHRGRTRSLLLFELLGRETAVEIDSRLLQRVN